MSSAHECGPSVRPVRTRKEPAGRFRDLRGFTAPAGQVAYEPAAARTALIAMLCPHKEEWRR